MASGWNLWVWLPCIGVVSGYYCKEVPYNSKFLWHKNLVKRSKLAKVLIFVVKFRDCCKIS